ncbi:MAG: 16S rRNA (uracil(1498)-N(3))-methyltransferase [Spirochaetales bacterium]|nr:16S rRNA (uracil(1498)-N(3))-methyltransferase [Spirochaetales bacterium]
MKQFVLEPGPETCSADGEGRYRVLGAAFHYLVRVRRLGQGSRFNVLLDGKTHEATLLEVDVSSAVIQLFKPENLRQDAFGVDLQLWASLLKGRKLDEVVRQAGELGTAVFQPIVSEHCVARWEDEKPRAKLDRWKAIAKEAAQQSGAPRVMEVRSPVSIQEAVADWSKKGPLLFFHQVPLVKASLHGYLSSRPSAVAVLIGPEGGFSERETELLTAEGGSAVWFGPTVLRAETAGTAALAAVKILLLEQLEWTIPS